MVRADLSKSGKFSEQPGVHVSGPSPTGEFKSNPHHFANESRIHSYFPDDSGCRQTAGHWVVNWQSSWREIIQDQEFDDIL